MKFGFDAKRIVNNNTGLGSYSRNLVNSLLPLLNNDDKVWLYTPQHGNDNLRAQVADDSKLEYRYPQKRGNAFYGSWWRTKGIVKQLINDKVDVFHGLSGELPLGIKSKNIYSVVTIHDLIFLRHPEFYNPIDIAIYKWKFKQTCLNAHKIIAISEKTKEDILHYSNFNEQDIKVIYQSASKRFEIEPSNDEIQDIKNKYNLNFKFVLNVGTIEERKNILLVVKALTILPEDIHLVIVGRNTNYTKKVVKWAKQNGVINRIKILNNITNQELPAIYKLAQCFAYPSKYEGFGLPIIEAIQCGLPVVACTGSCLEEAGGNSCIYVDCNDVEAMANAINTLMQGNNSQRVAMAQQYIKKFENNNVAQQVLNVLTQKI